MPVGHLGQPLGHGRAWRPASLRSSLLKCDSGTQTEGKAAARHVFLMLGHWAIRWGASSYSVSWLLLDGTSAETPLAEQGP